MMRRGTTERRLAQGEPRRLREPAGPRARSWAYDGSSASFLPKARAAAARAQLPSTAWKCTDDLTPVRLMRPAATARLAARARGAAKTLHPGGFRTYEARFRCCLTP